MTDFEKTVMVRVLIPFRLITVDLIESSIGMKGRGKGIFILYVKGRGDGN